MKLCKFLENYKIYTDGNETPEIFHIWVGLSVLAGAVEKRLWIPQGFFNIYLNLYLLLLSPPGVCAKSTSVSLGERLLLDAGITVFSDATTKQKLVMDMCESLKVYETSSGDDYQYSSITYTNDELNVLIDSGGVPLIRFLTSVFSKEGDQSDRTKGAGSYRIINPSLNLIGNAVPKWFASELATSMATTGLLARFIIVYETEKRGSYPRPIVTPAQNEARQKCLEMLYKITTLYGPIDLTKSADAFYIDWYHNQHIDLGSDERVIAYLDRKVKVHVPKIAGLMCIGDGRDQIEVIDFERAIYLIERIDGPLKAVYMLSGENKYGAYIDRIIKMLKANNGSMQIKTIMRALYTDLTKDEFKGIIEQLEEMEIAKRKKVGDRLLLMLIGGKTCQLLESA